LPQVPNCPVPSAEVSWPVFDDYGVTDPKARLTETAHGELRSKVEQLYYNFAESHDLPHLAQSGLG